MRGEFGELARVVGVKLSCCVHTSWTLRNREVWWPSYRSLLVLRSLLTGDAIADGTNSVQWNAGNSPEIVRVNN